ncbi:unnamed protein product [Caenorhabditis nigoni]
MASEYFSSLQYIWLNIVFFVFSLFLFAVCLYACLFVRWVYKRRLRQKTDEMIDAYKDEEQKRKEMELNLKRQELEFPEKKKKSTSKPRKIHIVTKPCNHTTQKNELIVKTVNEGPSDEVICSPTGQQPQKYQNRQILNPQALQQQQFQPQYVLVPVEMLRNTKKVKRSSGIPANFDPSLLNHQDHTIVESVGTQTSDRLLLSNETDLEKKTSEDWLSGFDERDGEKIDVDEECQEQNSERCMRRRRDWEDRKAHQPVDSDETRVSMESDAPPSPPKDDDSSSGVTSSGVTSSGVTSSGTEPTPTSSSDPKTSASSGVDGKDQGNNDSDDQKGANDDRGSRHKRSSPKRSPPGSGTPGSGVNGSNGSNAAPGSGQSDTTGPPPPPPPPEVPRRSPPKPYNGSDGYGGAYGPSGTKGSSPPKPKNPGASKDHENGSKDQNDSKDLKRSEDPKDPKDSKDSKDSKDHQKPPNEDKSYVASQYIGQPGENVSNVPPPPPPPKSSSPSGRASIFPYFIDPKAPSASVSTSKASSKYTNPELVPTDSSCALYRQKRKKMPEDSAKIYTATPKTPKSDPKN